MLNAEFQRRRARCDSLSIVRRFDFDPLDSIGSAGLAGLLRQVVKECSSLLRRPPFVAYASCLGARQLPALRERRAIAPDALRDYRRQALRLIQELETTP